MHVGTLARETPWWAKFHASMSDKHSGSMKITTRLNHMSHCRNSILYKMVEKMDLPSIHHKYSPRLDCGAYRDFGAGKTLVGKTGSQGYLTNKKTHHHRTLPHAYAKGHRGVIGGWACSYERGTPVARID